MEKMTPSASTPTLRAIIIILMATTLLAASSGFYLLDKYIEVKKTIAVASGNKPADFSVNDSALQSSQKVLVKSTNEVLNLAEENISSASVRKQKSAPESFLFAKSELQIVAPTNSNDLSNIIARWSKVVSKVSCEFTRSNGEKFYQSGSGMLFQRSNGKIEIWTNKHLTVGFEKTARNNCFLTFLNGEPQTIEAESVGLASNKNIDFAYLTIKDGAKEVQKINSEALWVNSLCKREAMIGESIIVLGYPTIGASQGITATEGIISGLEDNFYVTSAKIDHGSSGGIAISIKNNCYLGAPTFVKSGSLESLARILKWQSYGVI